MKKSKILIGAGLASAIAFSSLVSFAARPDFAGKMAKEDRMALLEQAQADRLMAQAEKAIDSANALHGKLTAKAEALHMTVPDSVTADFNNYIGQAQTALDAGDLKQAKLFANMAKDALEPLDLLVEQAEAAQETETE